MINWKTSLGGLLQAIGIPLSQYDEPIMKFIGVVLSGAGALLLGLAAKDSNVTGGTKYQ